MANNKIINSDQLQLALNEFKNKLSYPNIAFILGVLQNINGKQLSAYTSVYGTYGGYAGHKIQKNSTNLTKGQAGEYLKAVCGSEFTPTYNFDAPLNSYLIRASDGLILKPQYDATNGLVLYEMKKVLTSGQVTASDVNSSTATSGQVLTADGSGGASWQSASGGGGVYVHTLVVSTAYNIYLTLLSSKADAFTAQTLQSYLQDVGPLKTFIYGSCYTGSNYARLTDMYMEYSYGIRLSCAAFLLTASGGSMTYSSTAWWNNLTVTFVSDSVVAL